MIYCYNRVYTTHGSFHGSVVQNWWWWNHDLPELPTGGTQWSQRRGNGTKCSDISGHIHHKHPPEVSLVINQLNDQSHLPRMFAAQISFFCWSSPIGGPAELRLGLQWFWSTWSMDRRWPAHPEHPVGWVNVPNLWVVPCFSWMCHGQKFYKLDYIHL